MEDLAAMITQFLGSEDGMNQLRSVASALGLSDAVDSAAGPSFDPPSGSAAPDAGTALPDFSALFGQSAGESGQTGGIDMGTILLLQRALAAFRQSDRNTELLRALKPHFSPERAKKVDDAVRILQLIKLLPLLKDSGLLGRGGGGER